MADDIQDQDTGLPDWFLAALGAMLTRKGTQPDNLDNLVKEVRQQREQHEANDRAQDEAIRRLREEVEELRRARTPIEIETPPHFWDEDEPEEEVPPRHPSRRIVTPSSARNAGTSESADPQPRKKDWKDALWGR